MKAGRWRLPIPQGCVPSPRVAAHCRRPARSSLARKGGHSV